MSVENASSVLSGDRIRLDDDERQPGMKVTSTENGPNESVLCVLDDAGGYRRLVFLPDDSVMVTYYSNES
ncbi:MAG: hypothetical protein EBZ74_11125 [Planctomycetia bacterium]|nr:hypothetical protein [Planctomycetia bacterium]